MSHLSKTAHKLLLKPLLIIAVHMPQAVSMEGMFTRKSIDRFMWREVIDKGLLKLHK